MSEGCRALGILLRQLDDLEAARRGLERELENEQTAAGTNPDEAGFHYGIYAEGVIKRRKAMDQAIRSKEAELEAARESLNEAYRELKKYEVIRDNRIERERVEEARRDRIELDDIGIETFRRR